MQTQKPDTESIQIGHTVTIVDTNQHSNTLFIGPSAGGISIVIDGIALMTVTALTPMGKALIGKVVDDEISIVVGGNQQHFVITDIK
jgi:transcription elongation GreA/GreB family factor